MTRPTVTGSRYPTAQDAWKGGIQLFEDAKDRLPVPAIQTRDPAYDIKCELTTPAHYDDQGGARDYAQRIVYRCVPWCWQPQGQWQVRYYLAYDESSAPTRLQYAVSPDKLDEFIQNLSSYHTKATTIQPPSVKFGSTRLFGARYPTSPDAWKGGIKMFPIARPQLPIKNVFVPPDKYHLWLNFIYLGKLHTFRIVPHVDGLPNPQVLFYLVQYDNAKLNLYAVSPDKLDDFADHAETHLFVAGATYPKSEHEVNASIVLDRAMDGEWGEAFNALGHAWKAAVSDPGWWIFSFGLPTTGFIIARGAGAAGKYINKNSAATAEEQQIGSELNQQAQQGRLKGIQRVEGGEGPKPGIKGRKGDYDFVTKDGRTVKGDLHEPITDKVKSLQSNIYEKSGQAEIVVVQVGKGASHTIPDAELRTMAQQVVETDGLSINRVIVRRGKDTVIDAQRAVSETAGKH
jgi:hypothetical protein